MATAPASPTCWATVTNATSVSPALQAFESVAVMATELPVVPLLPVPEADCTKAGPAAEAEGASTRTTAANVARVIRQW